jgi:hypothetical protein
MKSLRSTGKLQAARARCRQLASPWKNWPVGEHAQAGRAVACIGHGDLVRHEMLADHAFAGAGLLDLGNDCGLPRAQLRAQSADEIARRRLRQRLAAHRCRVALALGLGDFLVLDRDDALEDVAHAEASSWLR